MAYVDPGCEIFLMNSLTVTRRSASIFFYLSCVAVVSGLCRNAVVKVKDSCFFEDAFFCHILTRQCPSTPGTCSIQKTEDPQFYGKNTLKENSLNTDVYDTFEEWLPTLEQSFVDYFRIDPNPDNQIKIVNDVLFSAVSPIPFKSKSYLAAVSDSSLQCLDLEPTTKVLSSPLFLDFVSGNYNEKSKKHFPVALAHRYGGHQFGYWAGQLGDGRASLLGVRTNKRLQRWELHLKGSGLTPYSRSGDGRAVIRSSVREFLVSEAMHYLGVPTSRAASLVVSDEKVTRDQFYNGNFISERTAMVLRLAPSWFRFGSLEILAKNQETHLLKSLLDFVITNHFQFIDTSSPDKYVKLYQEIVNSTASMIALWQSVGFTHGVCNTDNFSLLSVTIDYGPFGFMEKYNPNFIPNTSDDEGRYSYKKQPDAGFYNLQQLRNALLPVLNEKQENSINMVLDGYYSIYKKHFLKLFSYKFGFYFVDTDRDHKLISLFLKILKESNADFTLAFRQLGEIPLEKLLNKNINSDSWVLQILKNHKKFDVFIKSYIARLNSEGTSDEQRRLRMSVKNPRYILRNWMAQIAISNAENNDFSYVKNLYQILKKPFLKQEEAEKSGFASKTPSWASHIKISCSS